MKTYGEAVAFAERQRLNPTQSWYRMCQKFVRLCVGAQVYGGTALAAWNTIPASHRHQGTPPPGSIAYFDLPHVGGEAGHAVFVVAGGFCYSNDILENGAISKVPITLIETRWNMRRLGWIDWTPSGPLDVKLPLPTVDLSKCQVAATKDPGAPSGTFTYRPGVVLVEKALVRLGYLEPRWADGHWGTETIEGYSKFQYSLKAGYTDGKPRMADLVTLGRRGGFQVVA